MIYFKKLEKLANMIKKFSLILSLFLFIPLKSHGLSEQNKQQLYLGCYQKTYKPIKTSQNWSKLVKTGQNWLKLVQTGQNCQNWLKLVMDFLVQRPTGPLSEHFGT